MPEEMLINKQVKDIKNLICKDPSVIFQENSLTDLLREIIKDTRSRHVYVVDDHNKLVGSVRLKNTIQYMFPSITLLQESKALQVSSYLNYSQAETVKEIMTRNPSYVHENTTLAEMIRIMVKEQVNELPVLDREFTIIGEVNFLELITYYLDNME